MNGCRILRLLTAWSRLPRPRTTFIVQIHGTPSSFTIHHNYWKEGHDNLRWLVYTIVAKPYVKVTPRIELWPPNPSCDIGTTMVEDTAISTTYNLRLLFNPSYTVPTIDLTLMGTLCRRCGTCPLQTSPHYRFQTQSVHDRWDYLWVTIFYKFVIFNVHSLYASYDIHSRNRTGKSRKLNLLRSALARGWTRIYRSVTYDRPQCFTTEQGTLILFESGLLNIFFII